MLQNMSFCSAPPKTVSNLELSKQTIELIGLCGDSKRTESWVSASVAKLQASKLQAGF
jgi:hypothetical protein